MPGRPEEMALAIVKRQLESWLRFVEAITEASRQMRESQLAAALEAHASAVATRERIAKTTDPQELWRIQSEWASASLQRSLAYWRDLYQTTSQTQWRVVKCLSEPIGIDLPKASTGSEVALLGVMGEAYKRWVDTTRQFYASQPAAPQPKRQAA